MPQVCTLPTKENFAEGDQKYYLSAHKIGLDMRFLFLLSFCILAACTSSKKTTTGLLILSVPKNVMIYSGTAESPYGPCEPSIAINERDPKIILAGSILNNVHRSEDGGLTWQTSTLTSPFGVFGDPVCHADAAGNFYYAHLSDPEGKGWSSPRLLDRIVIDKSTDGGKTFVSSHTEVAHPKDQDKHWLASNPMSGHVYCTWTEFDLYNSKKTTDHSRIMFSSSTDAGDSWSKPLKISALEGDCLDDDMTTEGAVPAAGPNGQIYVAWAFDSKIYFDRSLNQGKTWLDQDVVAAQQVEGWSIEIPGIGRCNGMPVTECDLSNSKNRGTIYINWADQRNGKTDTDIFIAKSTDEGKTWSAPIRVNQDKTKTHQFFSWMTVDRTSGKIYVVYYDRSRYTDNQTDVVLAESGDGGRTWTNRTISESPFTPTEGVFFGDYNDISAYQGKVRPIWTRMEKDGKLSVWTAIID
jgi:hypothetical protein